MEYVTYRKYKTPEEAMQLLDLLKSNGIDCQVENISSAVDITFTGGTELEDKIAIKLKSSDFEAVDTLLRKMALDSIDQINKDHYLFDFSDDELFEILENFNEWSETDYLLAQIILNERGKKVTDEMVLELKMKKLTELRRPEKGRIGWIIFGYISAILGGLIGVFIGYHLYKFKKSLPTGEKVYAYDAETQNTGRIIFYVGLVSIVFWILMRVFDVI